VLLFDLADGADRMPDPASEREPPPSPAFVAADTGSGKTQIQW
jgi:hypothetical protein